MSRTHRVRLIFPLAAFALAGCGGVDTGGLVELPAPDRETFEESIQPLVALRCASRDCHGDPSRTLLLYSVEYFRLRPEKMAAPLDEAALLPAELDSNYTSLRYRMKGAGSAEETLLLRKVAPTELPWHLGHMGKGVFPTIHEPAYQDFVAWLATAWERP